MPHKKLVQGSGYIALADMWAGIYRIYGVILIYAKAHVFRNYSAGDEMKSIYGNMAIPLKKHPHWTEIVCGALAIALMIFCLIGFLAVCQ
jgi:hypothetical protein